MKLPWLANGYFVIGNSAVANISIVFESNGLQNGADAVALYQADDSDFRSGTPVTTDDLLDALVYDTNDGDDAGLLVLLNEGEAQINEDGAGDKDLHSLQRFPNGEGGLRNTATYTQAIPTPGAANTNSTELITLIINEVDADTQSSDVAEFIELYDGGIGNMALDGFTVVLYNGNGDASYNAFDLDGYSTDENGYFVLGNVAVSNVSLVFNNNGLQNGADAVALYQDDAVNFPNGTAVTTTNLVDALVYDTNDSDDAGLLVLLNAGQPQINEDGLNDKDAHSLQRLPNGAGGARYTTSYSQASPVSMVVNNGLPNQPIVAVDISLDQLADHPGELVRVLNTVFPSPGNLLFGGSNYDISDASGSAILRIDNDVDDVVGLAQPENCAELTGVVGRYYENYQLLPRIASDIPCAEEYVPTGDDLNIPKDQTLDIVTWNIEWFGDEGNSPASGNPNSDQIQKDSVKAVLLSIDADIYAVEEIADDILFDQMVSEMPGYDYVLSTATSYPDGTGVKQKIGFIYKTYSISLVSTKVLLESAHPYYNGGNSSYLADYPAAADRFFASGRLPFMMVADVNINGASQRVSFINIHARANNSSDPQLRYGYILCQL